LEEWEDRVWKREGYRLRAMRDVVMLAGFDDGMDERFGGGNVKG
jgi:hypothetical protein